MQTTEIKNTTLVTVNILSFNRKDELRFTLTKVFEQNYKNIEVIVVDNASSDGTKEMVKSEFSAVNLIELKENIGIAGWNKGFEVAKGEYVLVLDDDSYPEKGTIIAGLSNFTSNMKLGIVAFNIFNSRTNSSETEEFVEKPKHFVGCGAIVNRKVFEKIGYFNKDYFIYYHELDYSARCYDAGFDIRYLEDVVVIHRQNLLSRGAKNEDPFISRYRYYYYFLSYNIFLIQNFDLKYVIKYTVKWWLNRGIILAKHLYLTEYFKSIIWLIKNWKRLRKNKNILAKDTQEFYNYGNMPLVERAFFPNFKRSNKKNGHGMIQIYSHLKNIIMFIEILSLKVFFLKKNSKENNLLFVKNDMFLGDSIIGTMIFKNEEKFSEYHNIYFVINSDFSDLFKWYNGRIKIIYFNYFKYKFNIAYKLHFLLKIRKYGVKYCINLNYRTGLFLDELPVLLGANYLYGSKTSDKVDRLFGNIIDNFYDKLEPLKEEHELIRQQKLMSLFTNRNLRLSTTIPVIQEHESDTLFTNNSFIIISPISSNQTKDWPIENYKRIISKLLKEYSSKILLLGEVTQSNKISQLIIDSDRVFNLAGKTSLQDAINIMKEAKFFIGNDSGFAHFAHAVNTKYIVITGGGSLGVFFPYPQSNKNNIVLFNEMSCFGCAWNCVYDVTRCIVNVSVNDVWAAIKEVNK